MYKNSNVENDMEIIFLNLYNLIAHCNTILQYVDNVDFLPSTSYNIIKGEALALRAYFHFDLMRLWGPIPTNIDENYTYLPYVTQVSKSSSEYNTYEDYMSFLLEDLNEAERLLKMSDPIVNYSCDELNTGSMFGDYNRTEFYYRQNRMNYYGACALHARVALWMNDQQTAVSYADSIINATNADGSLKFTLGTASDVSEETQTNTNTLHTEHLFSIYYSYYNWQESWSTIQDNKHYFQWSKISSLFNGDENDFRFGTLVSRASPVYETNTDGIQRVPSRMNTGEDGSHAEYPRASKVFLRPPFGKLDASGSCWTRALPLNFSNALLSFTEMKASCFSAVASVRGWNRWV